MSVYPRIITADGVQDILKDLARAESEIHAGHPSSALLHLGFVRESLLYYTLSPLVMAAMPNTVSDNT